MLQRKLLASALVCLAALAIAPAHGDDKDKAKAKPTADAALITSAMSAAPPAVSAKATIYTAAADGTMKELRKGTNGFWCLPDDPQTPGPDPMCGDANAMDFMMAMLAHKPPPAGKVAFMYMLAGGTDASNTDPFAQKPTGSNHWIKTGPHIMIVASKAMMAGYPRLADPDTKSPYVMWADTPYEHLMIPVR